MTQLKTIKELAVEIRKTWKNVYFAAEPYLKAMSTLKSIDDMYYEDNASDIVNRFLCNAQTWRGEDARRIKAELKSLLK